MVRELSLVSDPVMLHIWSCLQNYAYDDALFAAERLFGETKNSESLLLLATSLYKTGRPKQVSRLLKSVPTEILTPKIRFLLANCYYDIGLLREAEESILAICLSRKYLDEITEQYSDQAVYVLKLLGDIRRRQGRKDKATECYKKCLELNPMMWTAFKNLCDMDIGLDASLIFRLPESLIMTTPTFWLSQRHVDAVPNQTVLSKDSDPLDPVLSRENVNPEKVANISPKIQGCDEIQGIDLLSDPNTIVGSDVMAIPVSEVKMKGAEPECRLLLACKLLGKTYGHVTHPESVLSNSVRFGNVQTVAVLQPSQSERNHDWSASVGNRATHETGSHRRLRIGEPNVAALLGSASGECIDGSGIGLRIKSDQPTSTPSMSRGSSNLRRLVSPASPNATSTTARSRNALPTLRSTTLKNSHCSKNAPSPVPSQTTSACPSIKTLLSAPRAVSHREDPVISEEPYNTGPRTRSQVAAAAAVARASGIQRRSNRLLRNRVTGRKSNGNVSVFTNLSDQISDTKASISQSEVLSSLYGSSSTTNKSSHDAPSFGEVFHSEVPVLMDGPLCFKDDPRIESFRRYMELLSHLGRSYQFLIKHEWKAATQLLSTLSIPQLATARPLVWAARAHMDNADYVTAERLFCEIRLLEPWQLLGMDLYSTVLWQLHADTELSHLTHDLLELDRNAPEPWCAGGNCFSLQGEHELAIRFFRKAIQVCPSSAYAYNLLGHEHSTLEEFDHAVAAFRHSMRLDTLQYNALFGLSNVFYKQEKYDQAESYLNCAVSMFSNSHLLLTNLGALRGRQGRLDDGAGSALELVTKAIHEQPKNPLARYHRASILFHLGRYREVLDDLEKLLVLSPRESMVYLMIGHTYKKLGNTPQAMIHYTRAMELDPKGANTHLRDIMANPPVAQRRTTPHRRGTSGSSGLETSNRSSQPQLIRSVVDNLQSSDRPSMGTAADDFDVGVSAVDLRHVAGETMSSLIGPSHTNTPSSDQPRGVRRLTDFSMLYDTEDYDEDAALSGAEDDHQFDTMDMSGDFDETSGQSLIDD